VGSPGRFGARPLKRIGLAAKAAGSSVNSLGPPPKAKLYLAVHVIGGRSYEQPLALERPRQVLLRQRGTLSRFRSACASDTCESTVNCSAATLCHAV
jgi:hypothetical protein